MEWLEHVVSSSVESPTAAAWRSFLLLPEALAWIAAAERGDAPEAVGEVALDVLLREYVRPVRLVLGFAASFVLVLSVTLSIAIVTVLGPYWAGESGAFFGLLVLFGLTAASCSAIVLFLLQSSAHRITRAVSAWSGAAPESADEAASPSGNVDTVDRWEVVASRALFLAVSAAGIVATVCAIFWLSAAEGGSFVVPLVIAVILQAVIWVSVVVGVVRVVRSARR